MMTFKSLISVPKSYGPMLALAAGLALPPAPSYAQGDALHESALPSALASRSLLMDLDQVGNRLIAVGERGHILISEDQASTWRQAQVPVRVTLTSSQFIGQRGWAVGHDGVVLRSDDAGASWIKLLDGNQANHLMLDHAQRLLSEAEVALADASEDQLEQLEYTLENLSLAADDAESFKAEGPSRPFLGLWFNDLNEGFIVGAFGLILRTLDGGDSWTPWFDRIDNPDAFHLNAITAIDDSLFIAAEAGGLYRSDDGGQSWILLESPYEGTFFGIVEAGNEAQGQAIIAYGLRGNAFISFDRGDSWSDIDTGTDASLFGGVRESDGSVVLVGASGTVLHVDASGQLLKRSQSPYKLPLSAVLSSESGLLGVGFGGVQPLAVQNEQ